MTNEDIRQLLIQLAESKRNWTMADEIPENILEKFVGQRDSSELIPALMALAGKNLRDSTFVSLWILKKPELNWPNDIAVRLAKYTSKSIGEDHASPIVAVIELLSEKDPELPYLILRRWVVNTSKSQIQPDLIFLFQKVKLSDPDFFIETVKAVARVESPIVLSGILFSDLEDLPPEDDKRLIDFINAALLKFSDNSWIREVNDDHLLELLADLLDLASVLLDEVVLSQALERVLSILETRRVQGKFSSIQFVLLRPWVRWGREVSRLAPWMMAVYVRNLSKISTHSHYYEEACKVLEQLKNWPPERMRSADSHVERPWRLYANERLKRSGRI